jgi:predicted transcriptional regulator
MQSSSTDYRLAIRVKPAQVAALDRVAADRGVTRNALIRQGIGHVLAEDQKKETDTARI